jgi:poly-beta-1,6-N-acetyl-D-glucosamine synthase
VPQTRERARSGRSGGAGALHERRWHRAHGSYKFGLAGDVDWLMAQRLLLVSPVHNEAAHLERVVDAVERQTRPPDLWVIVDDASTDSTPEIVARQAQRIDFIRSLVNRREPVQAAVVKDRLATAAAPRTFNIGLNSVDWRSFTHIAKLDGDTELAPDYFERLLAEFERDPKLGLAGGVYADPDPHGDGWRVVPLAVDHHVPGSLKCYSLPCLEAIGGVRELLGWDTVDEVTARMRGFRTRALPDLVVRHHRPWGSADGTLRGRARHGQCYYVAHFTLAWVTLRSFKVAMERPRVLSGLAFFCGYLSAAVRRVPRFEDQEFRRFFRRELRERARHELAGRVSLAGRLVPLSSRER